MCFSVVFAETVIEFQEQTPVDRSNDLLAFAPIRRPKIGADI